MDIVVLVVLVTSSTFDLSDSWNLSDWSGALGQGRQNSWGDITFYIVVDGQEALETYDSTKGLNKLSEA